jgi:sulfide:quinone oxidoreductase
MVTYPTFTHPAYSNVAIIGDLAAPALKVGMAGTLAVFQAAHVADRIAARAGGPPAPTRPHMSAICFVDTGHTGSLLHCDFTGPAEGNGPADCLLMPWLPYFRSAKQVFADEWFTTMLSGQIG